MFRNFAVSAFLLAANVAAFSPTSSRPFGSGRQFTSQQQDVPTRSDARVAARTSLYMSTRNQTGRDFYKILGVARNADAASIKQAYRKQAKVYHPGR
jgi:DnaJ-domain-containing protein 1